MQGSEILECFFTSLASSIVSSTKQTFNKVPSDFSSSHKSEKKRNKSGLADD